MNSFNRYLSGILLLLIGLTVGLLLSPTMPADWFTDDRAEVVQTEILRAEQDPAGDSTRNYVAGLPEFNKVAAKILPTVVYIETVVPLTKEDMPEDQYHDFDNPIWDRLLPQRRARAVGSGVIISPDGYILTNNHVVEGAVDNGIRVTLRDKRSYRARVVGTDPSTDLAVIRIDEQQLPQAVLGNSDQIAVGDWVLAVGNPFRLRSTITAGIISALGRDVQIINDQLRVESFIQTDAAINKGNSGGALVNARGELIGINTAIASQTGSYQGYGFAVPVNLAAKVATDLMEYGEVKRALLGVQISEVTYDRAQELGMEEVAGAEIQSVLSDGAAAKAGLESGDVIRSVAGKQIREPNELQEQVALMHPGDTIDVSVWRSGSFVNKSVILKGTSQAGQWLGQADPPAPNSQRSPDDSDTDTYEPDWDRPGTGVQFESFDVGFRVMALSKPADPKTYDLIITAVTEGTEAWKRGLREGDHILEVEGKEVEDLSRLRDLMRASTRDGEQVMLTVEKKDGSTAYYDLRAER
jgi:serine protease Do